MIYRERRIASIVTTTLAAPKIAANKKSPNTTARPHPKAASPASTSSSRKGWFLLTRSVHALPLLGPALASHIDDDCDCLLARSIACSASRSSARFRQCSGSSTRDRGIEALDQIGSGNTWSVPAFCNRYDSARTAKERRRLSKARAGDRRNLREDGVD
jgi:hypothetical protein